MRVAEHRVIIEDARRDGAFLRCTWHEDQSLFVVSHWIDDTVCVGATRIPASDAPEIIGLLADGLGDAAARRVERSEASSRPARSASRRGELVARIRRWWSTRRGAPPVPGRPATVAPVEQLDLSSASWRHHTG